MAIACQSTTKQLDASKTMLSDSGELTRAELEQAAKTIANRIANNLKKQGKSGYFAMLPVRNNTSEIIAHEVYADTLVAELSQLGFPALRVEDRERALKELEFSQTGLTDRQLTAGRMKVPDFFIETVIDENIFRSAGERIIEQTIRSEVRSVETQIVLLTERETYRKKPRLQGGGLGW